MLLTELLDKPNRKWSDVKQAEKESLIGTAITKLTAKEATTSAVEIVKWLKIRGITVSSRSIDLEMEKPQYKKYDLRRKKGTKSETRLQKK